MFTEERDEFMFKWEHLGNIKEGRPNLGDTTSVAIYRLMQYTLRDAAIKISGVETANKIFYAAGLNSGKAIYENLLGKPADLDALVANLQQVLKDLNIGILRFESVDTEAGTCTMTVSEDLDCSGLPVIEEAVCTYDEGLIAGVLEAFTGKAYKVREIDCWCTGERICRFLATPER